MQCTPTASKRLVSVCLFRASSPWFFSPGTPASFHKVKTDSDRYAGMTYSCPVYGSETHIKSPLVFWEFFDRTMVSGCQMLAWQTSPRIWEFEPSQAGSLIQQNNMADSVQKC